MRFIDNGPDIPDELLAARDAGNVLFFCGAGVSMAGAKLPSFVTLAKAVMNDMGASLRGEARKLFDSVQQFEKASGIAGLMPTDQIFGLLEREFEPTELQASVARQLKPVPALQDLTIHKALLDIARGPSGAPRLVTTNFDRIFEECDKSLKVWHPPLLPDPERERDFRGVIHLHGIVDESYQSALDDEFVLSIADFGRAYLAEGWATDYMRRLLERFSIVFIGYSAEDPPIKYLLEALNRSGKGNNTLYAFQSDDERKAIERWRQKGVEPIAYEPSGQHASLWGTVAKWAERARDVDGWYQGVIDLAKTDPKALRSYERGRVAYLASHSKGAKLFEAGGAALPPQWLFVFDPEMRYKAPDCLGWCSTADEPPLDPFEIYCLDSDFTPEPLDPGQHYSRRTPPGNARSCLELNEYDRSDLARDAVLSIRGSTPSQQLPPSRITSLICWIMSVAHHPVTLWWAAHGDFVHPFMLDRIDYKLTYNAGDLPESMRRGWRTLLFARQQRLPAPGADFHEINRRVQSCGWSPSLVREAIELYQPFVEVSPAGSMDQVLGLKDGPELLSILRISVRFLRPYGSFTIPDDFIKYATSLFRCQIEHWLQLKCEYATSYIYIHSKTISAEDSGDGGLSDISSHLNTYATLLDQLAGVDADAARNEVLAWPLNENAIFNRIRIWAAGHASIHSAEEAGDVLEKLSSENFWSDQQQSNLLSTLYQRWNDFTSNHKKMLEHRLLEESFLKPSDANYDVDKISALYRLDRLYWLNNMGLSFNVDVNGEIERLREIVPEWTKESSENAVIDHSCVWDVTLDTDYQSLDSLPIGQILLPDQANEEFDRRQLVNRQPFRGLVIERPVKALAALTNAAKRGYYPSDSWSLLLWSDAPRVTSTKMIKVIGHRLSNLPGGALESLDTDIAWWLRKNAKVLFEACPDAFDLLWNSMVQVLARKPAETGYRRSEQSWINEAINRPEGHLTEAAFEAQALATVTPETGLPETLTQKLIILMKLDERRAARVVAIISRQLSWIYHIDPKWFENHVLVTSKRSESIRQAMYEGLLSRSTAPKPSLFCRLKEDFFRLAESTDQLNHVVDRLAALFLLSGYMKQFVNLGIF